MNLYYKPPTEMTHTRWYLDLNVTHVSSDHRLMTGVSAVCGLMNNFSIRFLELCPKKKKKQRKEFKKY